MTELIQGGGNTLCSGVFELINSIWNKKELRQQWKKSIIVPIFKKRDKIDCSNCIGISLLPTTFNILSTILVLRLNLCVEEIIGDHQCGCQCNRSATN